MGVVGESGCGKSVTSLVTIGLATCDVDEGSITFEGDELIQKTPEGTERILLGAEVFQIVFHYWINPIFILDYLGTQ